MTSPQAARDARFARRYDGMLAGAESAFLAAARRDLLTGITGHVVDLGAGTGANLQHYARAARVTLVEPSEAMREQLVRRVAAWRAGLEPTRAAGSPEPEVTVLSCPAEALTLPDACADVVVTTLVLCSVDDPGAALAEARRILRPGGELRFLEHCRGVGLRVAAQRLLTPLMTRYAAGCRLDRDSVRAIEGAGFTGLRSYAVGLPWPYRAMPEAPFVAGSAHRPA